MNTTILISHQKNMHIQPFGLKDI